MNYFNGKPTIAKRKPHKRKAEIVIQQETCKLLFGQFLEFKMKQNLRPSTLNKFVLTFKTLEALHEERTQRPFYLADITTDFISDWVYYMKNEMVRFEGHHYKPESAQTVGLADATIDTRVRNLKTFVNWSIKQGLIQKNPFDTWEGFKKDAHTIEILTREELDNLLKVAKEHSKKSFKHFRDYCLLHLLIDGMCRITEALMISPSDIDHTNKTIIIQSTNAKSRKARIIPLSNQTYRLLIELIKENGAFEDEVDDLLFLSLSGRMLSKNNFLRDTREYAVEAGITKRYYLHLLRHSAATHYLSTGDVESLRKILGHADLRTVLIYSHMADDTVIEKHNSAGFFGTDNLISRKRDNKRK